MTPALLISLAVVSACQVQLCRGQEASSTEVYSGIWHNQLGSSMNLSAPVATGGFIHGIYYTILAATNGTTPAGVPLAGYVNSANNTFGFSAMWEGEYVVTWNGEYRVCNNVSVLFTTFTLKPPSPDCRLSPMSTRFGQDCFTRFRQVPLEGETCAADQPTNPCNTPC